MVLVVRLKNPSFRLLSIGSLAGRRRQGFHLRPIEKVAESMKFAAETLYSFHCLELVHGAISPKHFSYNSSNEYSIINYARVVPVGRFRSRSDQSAPSSYSSPEALRAFFMIDATGKSVGEPQDEFKADPRA